MLFLAGLVGMIAVPGLVFMAALAAARLVSQRLGLPAFRPFAADAPGSTVQHLAVRSASLAAAFGVCFLLAFAAAQRNGRLEPTTRVTVVNGGPAKRDGMKDGDRILAIDGQPIETWDAVRTEVSANGGPRTVAIERGRERLELVVTPNAERRIGVEQRSERRDSSLGESASDAWRMVFAPLRAVVPSFGTKTTLAGPVGIVKASRSAGRDELGGLLVLFAMFASFGWAAVALFHAFDAVLPSLRRLGD